MFDAIRGGLFALVTTTVLVMASAELGFYFGRRHRQNSDPDARSQISMIEGALLAMLGLLLGFTFSMAVSRYEVRYDLTVREANAISTALLRAEALPQAAYEATRSRFRVYADSRLEYVEAGVDEAKIEAALAKTARLQKAIWKTAQEAAKAGGPAGVGLYLMALTDLFDFVETRRAALENTVPVSMWVVLYLVTLLACGALGFGAGLSGRRLTLGMIFLPLLMAILLTLLLDLDHPRQGMIRVPQNSILRFRDSVPPGVN